MALASYAWDVLRILRVALLAVLALSTLSIVIAVGRPETGPAEKLLLLVGAVAVVAAGAPVRRLGTPR